MKGFYFHCTQGIKTGPQRIAAIDTEWAKNWRAAEPIVPFCSCIHSIYTSGLTNVLDIDHLHMETELYFRSLDESTEEYAQTVDNLLSHYIDPSTTLVGHQISTDLHTLRRCSGLDLPSVNHLIGSFATRKGADADSSPKVADTRYDIRNRVRADGGEKLRNVSLRFKIYAVQTELDEMSLTKMYNEYVLEKRDEKREKLQILNWRHAFQTALVWMVNSFDGRELWNQRFKERFLCTNDIIFNMGNQHFTYLNSEAYRETLSLNGILSYVRKYSALPKRREHTASSPRTFLF